MTVKQLAADYIERHAIPHKKPSSLKNDQRMLKAHILPAIGKLRVSAVRRGDLEKLLHPLKDKPCQSNRVRGAAAPHVLAGRPVEPAGRQSLRTDQALP